MIALSFLLFSPVLLVAQSSVGAVKVRAEIVYADDPTEVTVRGPDGIDNQAAIGMALGSGYTVVTASSSAELQLVPNGSALRLAPRTTFRIDSLAGELESRTNSFSLISGKIRTVAAKLASTEQYTVRTQSAVCGVRGTDFSRMYDPSVGKDWVCVLQGVVEVSSADGSKRFSLADGDFANLTAGYAASKAPPDWIATNFVDIAAFSRAVLPPR
jgi:hypothetical protein